MQKTGKTTVLITASLSAFLTPFMGSAVTIALPVIGKEYAISAITLGWIATAYILSSAAFLVPFGKLADIRGRKKIFAAGIAVYAFFSFLTPLARSSAFLIAFRTFQGIGGAMIFGTGVALLSSVFPPGERGKALGINTACVYLGLSLGPFLGGMLTQHFGWRSIFYINGMIGALLFFFTLWKLKEEWISPPDESLDLIGSAIYCLTISMLMIGITKLPAISGIVLVLGGTLGLGAFVFREEKARMPILNLRLFHHNTVFMFSNLAALINYCSTSASAFLMSLYLQMVRGYSPKHAGLLMISQPVVMTVFSPLAGRLSDRVESRTLASFGMTINTIALILLAFLGKSTSSWLVVFCLMLLGSGLALFSSPNTNAVMGSVDRQSYGVAAAILGTMRLTGQMLSMGIAMLIFSILIGSVRITPEVPAPFMSSMKTAYVVFAALSFAGIFASLARGKRKKEENE